MADGLVAIRVEEDGEEVVTSSEDSANDSPLKWIEDEVSVIHVTKLVFSDELEVSESETEFLGLIRYTDVSHLLPGAPILMMVFVGPIPALGTDPNLDPQGMDVHVTDLLSLLLIALLSGTRLFTTPALLPSDASDRDL